MVELFANSGDPDQIMHVATSDLGLHCLPVTHPFRGSPVYNGLTRLSVLGTLSISLCKNRCWVLITFSDRSRLRSLPYKN